ncbi:RNA-directed DNA polymerase-like protein [Alligator mississippiensis]|uniref:ribonuclease H n=1 Tax=Alligator mississippiensis TaxID=8496 RepID=A0A151PF81_ALLMI|nr:RNA-directed DNA polymerase-like protein [Alligator mississippiensis]
MYLASQPEELDLGPSLTEESGPDDVELALRLSKDQREQAAELIGEFADVFQETPGEARGVVHRIKTPPGQVIRESWRRIPQRLQSRIKAEIEMMLEKGVICRSHSDWRSPIVVVPKLDGKIHLCVDFRKVNAVAKFDAYPMPRVDELVENIGKARYISTLDLTKGYWQVPLAPEDQEKTAFATPWGLLQFQRMPFGLHGAAATFQRLMDRVLAPHMDYAAAYIDDIIYTEEWANHLQALRAVIHDLRRKAPGCVKKGQEEPPNPIEFEVMKIFLGSYMKNYLQ